MVNPLIPGLDFFMGFYSSLPFPVIAFFALCFCLFILSSFFRWFL